MIRYADFIKALQKVSSRNEKERLLKGFCDSSRYFTLLLDRTYSPEYVYGIKKVPLVEKFGTRTLEEAWAEADQLLTSLTERKLAGNAARDAILAFMETLEKEEAEVFALLLKGDLRCGINVSTINKAVPNTIPEYPYMRCSLIKNSNIDNFDWEKGVYSQEKADGMFVNLFFYEDGEVKITSRNGTVFANCEFEGFISEFKQKATPGYCYHGELLVMSNASGRWKTMPREIGNGILNHVLKGGSFEADQSPFFFAWDAVPVDKCVAGGKYEVPYRERLKIIQSIRGDTFAPIPTKVVHSYKEALEHYSYLVTMECEGTVIKNPEGIWKDGTSKDQIKIKIEAEADLIVRGFNPGSGRMAQWFGSLICESSDGKLQVNVSGFTDEDRERIHREMADWIDKKIITVRFNSIMKATTGPHRLFLPRFVEERQDKTEADSYEKIVEIFENTVKGT